MNVKDLILAEFIDDERTAMEFDNYSKVLVEDFKDCLDEVDIDEIIKKVEDSDYCNSVRFFFIYEMTVETLAEENGWEVLSRFPYYEIEQEEE